MKSTVENLDPTRIKLIVEVPYEEFKPSLDAAYKEIGSQIQVPGFRRGHVPAPVIDQRVGRASVIQEAVNNRLPDLYRDALSETERVPMAQPEVSVTELPNVTGAQGGQLGFTAEVTVRPVFDLPDLAGTEVGVDAVEVTDQDVDGELESLRARFGSLKSVEREAETGDFVTIDLKAVIDDEEVDSVAGVSYEIGKGNMLDGLDDALRGLKADESITFTTALAGGEHKGEEAEVTVTATAVKQRELPEADDEFAELASEFDTIVDNEIKQHLTAEGKPEDDEHAGEIRDEITDGVRNQIILDTLAESLEVGVSQDELIDFLVQMAQQYGMEPSQFIQGAQKAGQIPTFISEIARNKSLAMALRQVTVRDSTGRILDLTEFIGSDELDAQTAADADEAGETGSSPIDADAGSAESTESATSAGSADSVASAESPQSPE